MKRSSVVPAKLSFSRAAGLRIAALALFSCLAFLPLIAQSGFPRVAISIPTDQPLTASLQASKQCEVPGGLIVLPPVRFSAENSRGFAGQAEAVRSVSADSEVWLHVVVGADSISGKESEGELVARVEGFLKAAPLAAPNVRGLIVEVEEPMAAPDLAAFELLRLTVSAKASNAALRIAFVFQPGFVSRHSEIIKRLAPYADLLGTGYSQNWRADAAWIAGQALNKPVILKIDAATTATSPYLAAALATAGSAVEVLWSQPPDAKAANRACAENTFMSRYIKGNMLPLDSAAAPLSVAVDGGAGSELRWFADKQSPDLVLLAHVHGSPGQPRAVRLHSAAKGQFEVQWFDPATGTQIPAGAVVKSGNGLEETCACTGEYALVYVHKESNAGTALYSAVEVKGGVDLKVEEIIARWQQYREAQSQRLENYQASSFMNLHFETTNVAPGFDISMQLRQFYNRGGRMEFAQTAFYVNGVKFSNKHEFPLPQLEPEKVMSQPLELKISERYEYRLLGTEHVNGLLCFVIGVEPKVRDEALYSGKVWIDGTTFREVKEALSQRGSKSNVVVNVETQNYELVPDGKGNQFNLLRSVTAQQVLNAAGRDFVLQRTIQFSDYSINLTAPQFTAALESEHRSDDPMYGETDKGLRGLKKQNGERVLEESSDKRIRSIVAGAMYEGTFNFPIPFTGFSIADFDFRHTGAQLSTFFAGPILATDLSKQYKGKYRLGFDLALSAIPGENRIYVSDKEQIGQEMWTWEEDTGVRASWQATTHLSLTGSTYLAYNIFRRTSDTSNTYALPRNGVALLPGLEFKYTRRGYVFSAQGTRGERIAWKSFGYTPEQKAQSGYTLYNADINKDYYIKKFTKGGWDFSYYGGNQLDRFSRYFPSFFSQPRLHGIPSGTDSFDAMAMGNAHYGFNVMDMMKLELMYSYARARNLEESSRFKKFDGLETNFNTAGPFGTLVQGTVSYALDGNIQRYNSRWGVYMLILKPLH
jgi:hypothetical protein